MSEIASMVAPGGHGEHESGLAAELRAQVFQKFRDDMVAISGDFA